jgi:Uncharacterized secreted protein
MRISLFFVTLVAVLFSSCASQMAESRNDTVPSNPEPAKITKQPVLVELFTSEGCSSCPPADRTAAFLEREQPVPQADVITLAFHVDYWDGPEWKDEFSSALFSERQNLYGEAFHLDAIYTPEMVIDGHSEFVGSDSSKATKEITAAANASKGNIETSVEQNKYHVSVKNLPKHEAATAYLAVAEDKIMSNVRGGENAGSNFTHMSVVRELKPLGTINSDADGGTFQTDMDTKTGWKSENLKYVVFVQDNKSRKILAVAKAVSVARP